MIGEVWKVVPSKPQFLASSEGRIMVAPYFAEMPRGGKRQYGGEPHFGVWNKLDGRFVVYHKGRTYKVHQLVCEAFNGAKPFEKAVVMHLDENAANNRPSNLAWGTQAENLNAPLHTGYKATGEIALRDAALPRGVSQHKASGKFQAYSVGSDGRQKYLGLFNTPAEAALAVENFVEASA